MATGNWSARELCALLNVDGDILDGVEGGSLQTSTGYAYGYSMAALAAGLDNIARGNWGGHPAPLSDPPGQHLPTRPLGLRDRLAAAAV